MNILYRLGLRIELSWARRVSAIACLCPQVSAGPLPWPVSWTPSSHKVSGCSLDMGGAGKLIFSWQFVVCCLSTDHNSITICQILNNIQICLSSFRGGRNRALKMRIDFKFTFKKMFSTRLQDQTVESRFPDCARHLAASTQKPGAKPMHHCVKTARECRPTLSMASRRTEKKIISIFKGYISCRAIADAGNIIMQISVNPLLLQLRAYVTLVPTHESYLLPAPVAK